MTLFAHIYLITPNCHFLRCVCDVFLSLHSLRTPDWADVTWYQDNCDGERFRYSELREVYFDRGNNGRKARIYEVFEDWNTTE